MLYLAGQNAHEAVLAPIGKDMTVTRAPCSLPNVCVLVDISLSEPIRIVATYALASKT